MSFIAYRPRCRIPSARRQAYHGFKKEFGSSGAPFVLTNREVSGVTRSGCIASSRRTVSGSNSTVRAACPVFGALSSHM